MGTTRYQRWGWIQLISLRYTIRGGLRDDGQPTEVLNGFPAKFEYGKLRGVAQTGVPVYDERTDQRSAEVLWYGDEPGPSMA